MTNWEKYKEEILKITVCDGLAVVDGKLELCNDAYCSECEFNKVDVDCGKLKLDWLDEEYKDPSPYKDWEIDDKIEVRNSDRGMWNKRYFAGIDEAGEPLAWFDGRTSWSTESDNDKKIWKYARKVED